ncbi:hypothetical protein SDC9_73234 [bioreactor metagenome]|uniref:Uncharacterized protein n=1 Tax=bioreactor metagenome TaxID=1076179 RepID=A0A644YEJ9_9ZZZZ
MHAVGRHALAKPPHGNRVIAAQKRRQPQHGGHRERRGQAAIGVHGDEQPPEGAAQPGRGKQPGQPTRAARRCRLNNGIGERRQRRQLQPPQRLPAPRPGQRQRLRQPGEQRQGPQPPGVQPSVFICGAGICGRRHRLVFRIHPPPHPPERVTRGTSARPRPCCAAR